MFLQNVQLQGKFTNLIQKIQDGKLLRTEEIILWVSDGPKTAFNINLVQL